MGRSIREPKVGDFRTGARPPWLQARPAGFALALHVQPGARRSSVVGLHGQRLKIAVAAPPVEGRANEALIDFLAMRFGLPKACLSVVAGAHSREKRVAVDTDLSADALLQALAARERR